ncbi:hypothetical protein SERLA73DRAFT_184540 [Serpula lacrymans var. lacrymans S7.3]|uniref:Uncharacterized protein n=2 Tax=Serpula lacrymans var. lacrymans TaxID=341189 RepID=F8Q3G0_SERL3|nr:uncharacterized protein SERLADRAFT_472281 [Serpula lacrymans var. lacrymans S7.9]EGN97721.1 hypothetical protein SERLA73DRAFT_184540 [Serpula lacrymans var. lacrymans S7.3]EGO23311.1 hypothetical protein SERLADRAFT_472281 [Serpula lacrymans var. lacrymans S7.9]
MHANVLFIVMISILLAAFSCCSPVGTSGAVSDVFSIVTYAVVKEAQINQSITTRDYERRVGFSALQCDYYFLDIEEASDDAGNTVEKSCTKPQA